VSEYCYGVVEYVELEYAEILRIYWNSQEFCYVVVEYVELKYIEILKFYNTTTIYSDTLHTVWL